MALMDERVGWKTVNDPPEIVYYPIGIDPNHMEATKANGPWVKLTMQDLNSLPDVKLPTATNIVSS